MPGFVVSTGTIDKIFGPLTNRRKDVVRGHDLYWAFFHIFEAKEIVFSSEDFKSPHVNRYNCKEGYLQTTTWGMELGPFEHEISCVKFAFFHSSKEYCASMLDKVKKVAESQGHKIVYSSNL